MNLQPIGYIRSTLRALSDAPRQGSEGAPDAWLDLDVAYADGLLGIKPGDELLVITWLHRADREVLQRHSLGLALLAAGQAREAEVVYREDLERFPRNGWSLLGSPKAWNSRAAETRRVGCAPSSTQCGERRT